MKLKAMLAALPLTALTLLGVAALPAQAAEAGTVSAQAASGAGVTIHLDNGANGFQVANAISNINEDNRGKFVEKAVDTAFEVSGGRYNVVMMNLSQGYNERLTGKKLYANVRYGHVNYGLWISEAGQFTNNGDGGWINWGMRGWFDRDGKTVNFRRP